MIILSELMVSFIYYIILVCKFTYVGTLGNSSDNNSSNSSQQNTNRNKESVEERLDALMKKAKFNNNSNHSSNDSKNSNSNVNSPLSPPLVVTSSNLDSPLNSNTSFDQSNSTNIDDRSAIKVKTITWNMSDSLVKGDLEVLLGNVPPYHSQPHSSNNNNDNTLPSLERNDQHPYHLVVVAGQECPTTSNILPRGFSVALRDTKRPNDSNLDLPNSNTNYTNSPNTSSSQLLSNDNQNNPNSIQAGWSGILEQWFCHGAGIKNDNLPSTPIDNSTSETFLSPPPLNKNSSSQSNLSNINTINNNNNRNIVNNSIHNNSSNSNSNSNNNNSNSNSNNNNNNSNSNNNNNNNNNTSSVSPSIQPTSSSISNSQVQSTRPPILKRHFSKSSKFEKGLSKLTNYGSGPYELLIKERLMGIYIAVFVFKDCKHLIQGTSTSVVPAGLLRGRLGNKGAVGVSLKLAGTRLLFINSHLAAHEHKLGARLDNMQKIQKSLSVDTFLPPNDSRNNKEDITERFDFTWIMGDLNMRVDITRKHADWLIMNKDYKAALEFDQLRNVMKSKQGFVGFNEAEITFPPTFKYDVRRRSTRHNRRKSWDNRSLNRSNNNHDNNRMSLDSIDDYVEINDDDLSSITSTTRSGQSSSNLKSPSMASSHLTSDIESENENDDEDEDEVLRIAAQNASQLEDSKLFAGVDVDKAMENVKDAFRSLVKPIGSNSNNSNSNSNRVSRRSSVNKSSSEYSRRNSSFISDIDFKSVNNNNIISKRRSSSSVLTNDNGNHRRKFSNLSVDVNNLNSNSGPLSAGSVPFSRSSFSQKIRQSFRKPSISSSGSNNNYNEEGNRNNSIDESLDNFEQITYDSSPKQRVPSWCDRILWRSTIYQDNENLDRARNRKFSKLGNALSNVLRRRSSSRGSVKELTNSISINNLSTSQKSHQLSNQLHNSNDESHSDNDNNDIESDRQIVKLNNSKSAEDLSKVSNSHNNGGNHVSFLMSTPSPMGTVKSDKKKFLSRLRSNSLGNTNNNGGNNNNGNGQEKNVKNRKSFSFLENLNDRRGSHPELTRPPSPSISPKTPYITTTASNATTIVQDNNNNYHNDNNNGSSMTNIINHHNNEGVSKWLINSFPSLFSSRNSSNNLLQLSNNDSSLLKTNSDSSNQTSSQLDEEAIKRRGQVECLSYSSLTDSEMIRLEGRSDHRPVIGSFLAWT